jgi:hypothetical protein
MNSLDLVKISVMMPSGGPRMKAGLIDGTVATKHLEIFNGNSPVIPGKLAAF